jgi:Gpi18-like mannosyltransferase
VAILALTAAGLVGTRVLDLREGHDPVIGLPPHTWPGIWARWDSPYYYNIAREGYAAHPYAMGYFPLYPLLVSGVSKLTGLHLVTAGVVIAHVSYLVMLLVFYQLGLLIRPDPDFAWRAVLALAVFPSSFFFLAMYAESLSLAFGLLAIYAALRGRWVWSGLALGVAAAARPVGWLIGIVLLVEFLRRRPFTLRSLATFAAGGLLAGSGVVAYVVYLYTLTGRWTAITEAQALWLRKWTLPWVALGKSVWIALTGNDVAGDWFLYAINWSDLLFTLFAIVMTFLAVRRLPASLTIYLAVTLVFVLCQQGVEVVPLWGMTRWVAALVPIYFVLADWLGNRRRYWVAVSASAPALMVLMAWWSSGRWVG